MTWFLAYKVGFILMSFTEGETRKIPPCGQEGHDFNNGLFMFQV